MTLLLLIWSVRALLGLRGVPRQMAPVLKKITTDSYTN